MFNEVQNHTHGHGALRPQCNVTETNARRNRRKIESQQFHASQWMLPAAQDTEIALHIMYYNT